MAVVIYALAVATFILLIVYLASTWKYSYWKKRKVPHLPPVPLFGNYKDYILLKEILGLVTHKICQRFPNEPYIGTYYGTEPALVVQDLDLIKLIMTKDFPYFNGREITNYSDNETITRNLFFTYGDHWKMTRQSMSPLFSSAKIRSMFPLIQNCTRNLDIMFEKAVANARNDPLDVIELVSRYTMDCICSCGFGVDTNVMGNLDKENPFFNIGKIIFENSIIRGFSFVARSIWPSIFYGVGLTVFPKAITNFFAKVLNGVFESRNYVPSTRNDFVDMVLNLKKSDYITCESILSKNNESNKVSLKIDNEFLSAQCVVFFAAGYETSSTTTSFTLFELAKDLQSQQRAAEEIDEYLRRHEGKLGYECVNELPFLGACIDETLRLYPVLSLLTREVMQDYTLPDGLLLEKGMRVHLPVYHLHRHPDHFPQPDEFRPERFLPENKQDIKPYSYMPFGEGPRICIGMRIAKLQMTAGFVTILHKYRVELPQGAPKTVVFDPTAFVTNPKGGIKLKFIPRNQ